MKRKMWIWIAAVFGGLLLLVCIVLSVMAGSPNDVYGMVRYALPHMHRGNLRVGDEAPDARVLALDGTQTFHIREHLKQRPLVLIFGSFT